MKTKTRYHHTPMSIDFTPQYRPGLIAHKVERWTVVFGAGGGRVNQRGGTRTQRVKYMFTPPQIAVVSTRKPNRRGLPLTGKNGDFSAITVTERSWAAPTLKVERYISDRFLLVLSAA